MLPPLIFWAKAFVVGGRVPVPCIAGCLAASLASAPQMLVIPFPPVITTKTVSRHWHMSLGEMGKVAPGEDHYTVVLNSSN